MYKFFCLCGLMKTGLGYFMIYRINKMMNKVRILIGLLIVLFFSMCTSPKQRAEGELPVLDVADGYKAALPDTFTWNSVTKNVRMIPLKTEKLIGRNPVVSYFSEDLIIVSDNATQSVYVFDGEGREKVSFSHYGPGPKEYLFMTRVNYNEKDSLILLFDNGKKKLLRFDMGGNFVDARPADASGNILQIDSEGNLFSVNREGKSLVTVWNSNLQLMAEYLPFDTLYNDSQRLSCQMLMGKGINSDTFRFLPVLGDTVYAVTKEGINPVCVLDRSGYKCSQLELNKMMDVRDSGNYLNTEIFYCFSSYFYYIAKSVVQLWDMNTGELVARHRAEPIGNYQKIWGLRYVFPSGNEFRKSGFDYVYKNSGVFILQADKCLDDVEGLTADDNPVILVLEF